MAKGKSDRNTAILEYALRHLEQELAEIQGKIDHIHSQLGGRVAKSASSSAVSSDATAVAPARRKRVLSAAARKRIALAQKRRWAEHRKAKAKAE